MQAPKGSITAGELIRQLEADPAWVAQRDARDRDRLRLQAERRREEVDLRRDLAAVGVVVDTVWDLVGAAEPPAAALPVLLDHLSRPYSDRLRETIGRALANRAARPLAWDRLVDLARTGPIPGLMLAIAGMAQPGDLDTLLDLVSDRSLGADRLFLIPMLMRSRRPRARQVLLDLRDDPDLCEELAVRLKLPR